MKISSIVLFSIRMFLYFSVITLIFIHPGIAISFDRIGLVIWLLIVPAIMSVTYFLPKLYVWWIKIAALEPFFLAWVCIRLLSLSRSGEEIAGQSIALTQFILVWTAVVFLLHSVVIYLCIYPNSRIRVWKEGLAFFIGSIFIFIILLVVLPPDFVRNTIIQNLITERIPQRIQSDSDRGIPQRGAGRRTLPRNEGGRGELRGLSEHNWPGSGRGSGDSGESRQYMVKIVASDREPIYMGESFRGQLDPVQGFLLSTGEHLNELARQRFFVTWSSNEQEFDNGRRPQEVFSLSTLQRKYLPFRPVVIDPVILNENAGPLRYIHQVVSSTHYGEPLMLVHIPSRPLSSFERRTLDHYLDVSLEENDRSIFENYYNNALNNWRYNRNAIIESDRFLKELFSFGRSETYNEYLETIIALLVSFSSYQYNLNPDDDHSIASLKHFILNSKEGDCVEFSNTLALLGRIAGIPSRVVTGYLAAESLQTPAHLRGLAVLRSRIPVLQRFPFDNLYMVTNIHSHSWTQFYIPGYGWLDFESTAFSIPPQDMGDFNNWDVVIPILDENRTFSQVRKFPWQAVGRAGLTLIIFAVICAYVLRYGRELILYYRTQSNSDSVRNRARSLYLLLLSRLAADGQPIKPASKTAHEYDELFKTFTTNQHEPTRTNLKEFADIYSELRWRQFTDQTEENERFQQLENEYKNILNQTRRRGLHRAIIRIISLRGLAYL